MELPSDSARLVVLKGEGAGRSCVVMGEAVIGRNPDSQLAMTSGAASRRHARVFASAPREFSIEDLGSRNGTTVNGERLGPLPRVLAYGDKIEIGGSVLLFGHFDPAEQQMLHAQKLQALGQLAGGIAHDINNLVGAVLANVEYLRTPGLPLQEREPCLADCQEALQRVVEMARRLVGFAGRGRCESRPVSISHLVDEAWRLTQHRRHANVGIQVVLPPDLSVLGDSTQLIQVMTNLFANAVDAMPDGGVVTVSGAGVLVDAEGPDAPPGLAAGHFVRLSVKDSGEGIPAHVLPHVFEPFFTTKPAGRGTGLGLATVHGIINNHGGQVTVASTPGVGSEFVMHLPSAWAPSVATESPLRAGARVKTSKPHAESGSVVLIVDDEPMVCRSAHRLVTLVGGFEVVTAACGEDALVIHQDLGDRIALTLLDLNMPGLGGAQTCREIKRLHPTARVVLTSGSSTEAEVLELVSLPEVQFIRKPHDVETLRPLLSAARWAGVQG